MLSRYTTTKSKRYLYRTSLINLYHNAGTLVRPIGITKYL